MTKFQIILLESMKYILKQTFDNKIQEIHFMRAIRSQSRGCISKRGAVQEVKTRQCDESGRL